MVSRSLPRTASLFPTAGRPFRREMAGPLLVVLAIAVWSYSLGSVKLGEITDIGLVSVLPAPMLLAVAALSAGFCLELRQPRLRAPVLLLFVVAQIIMLFGVTALVEPLPRFESAWKHVGVTEFILRTGTIDPTIDAYFNWPGFFILAGFLTEVGGFGSTLELLDWAPVVYNLLYLGPLLMLFSRATSDRRLVWFAVWLFYLANWVGQDYFSPQAFAYLLYLAILAVLVTWFAVPASATHPIVSLLRRCRLPHRALDRFIRWVAPGDLPTTPIARWQRWGLAGVVILLYAAAVPSHQLTPFAILGAVAALVICNRCSFRTLPVIMAIMAVLWIRYMASAYFAGHESHVTEQIGAVGDSVGSNMGERLSGSPGHLLVVYLRTAMTVVFWGLAALGGIRRLINGRRDFTFALLAAATFPLLGLQSYGGEMLLRIYLFSLPFMAFFVAALFFATPRAGSSRFFTITLTLVTLAFVASFFVTRYGNERMDYFTPAEAAAVDYLYDVAPPGSLLLAGTVKTPWKYRDYEKFKHRTLADHVEWPADGTIESDLDEVEAMMKGSQYPAAFLIITRSQIANDEMFGLLPFPLTEFEDALARSDRFQIMYQNADATIFAVAPPPEETSS